MKNSILVLIAACVWSGCALTRTGPAATPQPATSAPAVESVARASGRGIAGQVTVTQNGRVHLALVLDGPAAELQELRLAQASRAPSELQISDSAGAVPFQMQPSGRVLRVRLQRMPTGALTLRYQLAEAVADFDDPAATNAAPDRLRLSGETALLLPVAFDEVPVDVRLRYALPQLPKAEVASSLQAHPPLEFRCQGSELRHATFLVGRMGRAQFETPEGRDDWAWLEVLGFDARPVSGETAALRSQLGRYFEARASGKYVVLLLAQARQDGGFSVVRRNNGLLVQLPVEGGWSSPVRIAVTRELFRPWFGDEVRLVSQAGQATAAELWFNEGVARSLARELLFRFGMLTPEEYREEVNGLMGTLVLSPRQGQAPPGEAEVSPAVRREMIARGALYATSLMSRLRADGVEAFDGIVRELFSRARSRRGALFVQDWFDAAGNKFGKQAEAEYRRTVVEGQLPKFAQSALGRCFALQVQTYAEVSPGFDLEGTRARSDGKLVGLDPVGPAVAAGLRETDHFVSAAYRRENSVTEMEVSVTRDQQAVTLRYLPRGISRSGPVWIRKPDVPDDRCR